MAATRLRIVIFQEGKWLYGLRKRSVSIDRGPQGRAVIVYLWRDADHFAESPGVRKSEHQAMRAATA